MLSLITFTARCSWPWLLLWIFVAPRHLSNSDLLWISRFTENNVTFFPHFYLFLITCWISVENASISIIWHTRKAYRSLKVKLEFIDYLLFLTRYYSSLPKTLFWKFRKFHLRVIKHRNQAPTQKQVKYFEGTAQNKSESKSHYALVVVLQNYFIML